MRCIREEILATFGAAIQTAFGPALEAAAAAAADDKAKASVLNAGLPVIVPGRNSQYQCNNVFALNKAIGGKTSPWPTPKAIAEALVAGLPAGSSDLVTDISVAPNGFVNFNLSSGVYLGIAQEIFSSSTGLPPAPALEASKQHIIVDFSSPNIAKSMHVGHLRSTIIGDTICRVLEYAGAEVERINHVGDWGTQFGMLLVHLFDTVPAAAEGRLAELPIEDLVEFYKAAKVRFDEDADFNVRAHDAVVRLQAGDAIALGAWKALCDVSRKEFNKIYESLGVRLTERGESFYNPYIPAMVERACATGISEIDDGATIIRVDNHGSNNQLPPLILRKRDGGFGYDSTDITAIWYRTTAPKDGEATPENPARVPADRVIYVTDNGQSSHFEVLFLAAERLGMTTYDHAVKGYRAPRLDHVGFGVVLGEDGKKFKTRSGATVRLQDLLSESVIRARAQLEERYTPEEQQTLDIDAVARAMGISAVKYADLSCLRHKDYTFSYDRMLNFKGNTAVYLLYAYARICQIAGKAQAQGARAPAAEDLRADLLKEPSEIALLTEVARHGDVVAETVEDLCPHHIADHLYALCTKFSDFYTKCRVVSSNPEDADLSAARLAVVEVVRRCIQSGCNLLGLTTVERM